MNVRLSRTNMHPANCDVCGVKVPAQRGYVIPRDAMRAAVSHSRKWVIVCTTVQCASAAVGQDAVEQSDARELRADGSIAMPYDESALPLLRAISEWDPAVKCWRASLLLRDRDLVLAVADKLALAVDESLREYEDPPSVRAAVERARAVPTIRDYQVDGVRWLAYRGTATGAEPGYKDKRPGAVLADDMGLGKQHPVDTRVLTPHGWQAIGGLSVGDEVIGSGGKPTKVLGVFPQGVKPSYRVSFSDGSSVEAGPEHLWTARYYSNGRDLADITLTTEQLRTRDVPGRRDFSKVKLYLPILSAPVEFAETPALPIPPYTLGALIANGGLGHGTPSLTVGTVDWPEVYVSVTAEGSEIRSSRSYIPTVTTCNICGIVSHLRGLELAVNSSEKRIPRLYLQASVQDRIALLHGLMDGDGSCSTERNKISYSTCSVQLARDVQELVQCLGGVARIRVYDRSQQDKGIEYRVHVRMPNGILPFRLRRKAERYNPGNRAHPVRTFKTVEYVRDVESVCIAVAAEDRLYVTEQAILTHNTIQTLLVVDDSEALVIVCPANAKAVWPREAEKWRPGRFDTITICNGGDSFRWPSSPRELVVINYDVLPWTPAQIKDETEKVAAARAVLTDSDEDAKKRKRLETRATTNAARKSAGAPTCPVLIVADEAHYIENNKALRTVRWRHIAAMSSRVIGLTGTPVESEPLKLFGLLTSLRCNPFSWSNFLAQFNGSAGRWGGIEFERVAPLGSSARGSVKVEPGTTEILQRSMLRRTKDQVLSELPPKVYSEIPVELPPKLIRELDEIAAQHIDILLRGELPEFPDMAAVRKALALASVDAMLEIVESHEASGIPLVVFSAHRGPIELLEKRKGWHAITGSTTAKKRGEIQDAFQRGEGFGVAGTRAMAEAMTLTRASTVLFVDRFWERKYNIQAEDRCHRIGQHDSVNVVTLVPDHPLTQHVADLLGSKYAFVDSVLHGEQGYDAPPSRFTPVDSAEYQARIEAKAAADKAQQEADAQRNRARRERELASIAEREVTPKVSETRAKLRAERLGIKPDDSVPAHVVQSAMSFMLSVCDGAHEKDDTGFNAPDASVARWLAPGVAAGHEYALASAAAILRHYPRQLAGDFAELFTAS